ncbi:hypothetical protein EVAR_92739_1 [Eumeta japonica]|uniref:Uncharacterized protein n=1 Tax=Eumeta variegata TaxID=151549 RepID=A0A4C1SY26_EUMVA|nr:hypothetical protein EVAR_92739_1 [Eumeta japonica]
MTHVHVQRVWLTLSATARCRTSVTTIYKLRAKGGVVVVERALNQRKVLHRLPEIARVVTRRFLHTINSSRKSQAKIGINLFPALVSKRTDARTDVRTSVWCERVDSGELQVDRQVSGQRRGGDADRSDSSAAWLASASLAVAVASRSSERSRSSSSSWMRRLSAATSDSACTQRGSANARPRRALGPRSRAGVSAQTAAESTRNTYRCTQKRARSIETCNNRAFDQRAAADGDRAGRSRMTHADAPAPAPTPFKETSILFYRSDESSASKLKSLEKYRWKLSVRRCRKLDPSNDQSYRIDDKDRDGRGSTEEWLANRRAPGGVRRAAGGGRRAPGGADSHSIRPLAPSRSRRALPAIGRSVQTRDVPKRSDTSLTGPRPRPPPAASACTLERPPSARAPRLLSAAKELKLD